MAGRQGFVMPSGGTITQTITLEELEREEEEKRRQQQQEAFVISDLPPIEMMIQQGRLPEFIRDLNLPENVLPVEQVPELGSYEFPNWTEVSHFLYLPDAEQFYNAFTDTLMSVESFLNEYAEQRPKDYQLAHSPQVPILRLKSVEQTLSPGLIAQPAPSTINRYRIRFQGTNPQINTEIEVPADATFDQLQTIIMDLLQTTTVPGRAYQIQIYHPQGYNFDEMQPNTGFRPRNFINHNRQTLQDIIQQMEGYENFTNGLIIPITVIAPRIPTLRTTREKLSSTERAMARRDYWIGRGFTHEEAQQMWDEALREKRKQQEHLSRESGKLKRSRKTWEETKKSPQMFLLLKTLRFVFDQWRRAGEPKPQQTQIMLHWLIDVLSTPNINPNEPDYYALLMSIVNSPEMLEEMIQDMQVSKRLISATQASPSEQVALISTGGWFHFIITLLNVIDIQRRDIGFIQRTYGIKPEYGQKENMLIEYARGDLSESLKDVIAFSQKTVIEDFTDPILWRRCAKCEKLRALLEWAPDMVQLIIKISQNANIINTIRFECQQLYFVMDNPINEQLRYVPYNTYLFYYSEEKDTEPIYALAWTYQTPEWIEQFCGSVVVGQSSESLYNVWFLSNGNDTSSTIASSQIHQIYEIKGTRDTLYGKQLLGNIEKVIDLSLLEDEKQKQPIFGSVKDIEYLVLNPAGYPKKIWYSLVQQFPNAINIQTFPIYWQCGDEGMDPPDDMVETLRKIEADKKYLYGDITLSSVEREYIEQEIQYFKSILHQYPQETEAEVRARRAIRIESEMNPNWKIQAEKEDNEAERRIVCALGEGLLDLQLLPTSEELIEEEQLAQRIETPSLSQDIWAKTNLQELSTEIKRLEKQTRPLRREQRVNELQEELESLTKQKNNIATHLRESRESMNQQERLALAKEIDATQIEINEISNTLSKLKFGKPLTESKRTELEQLVQELQELEQSKRQIQKLQRLHQKTLKEMEKEERRAEKTTKQLTSIRLNPSERKELELVSSELIEGEIPDKIDQLKDERLLLLRNLQQTESDQEKSILQKEIKTLDDRIEYLTNIMQNKMISYKEKIPYEYVLQVLKEPENKTGIYIDDIFQNVWQLKQKEGSLPATISQHGQAATVAISEKEKEKIRRPLREKTREHVDIDQSKVYILRDFVTPDNIESILLDTNVILDEKTKPLIDWQRAEDQLWHVVYENFIEAQLGKTRILSPTEIESMIQLLQQSFPELQSEIAARQVFEQWQNTRAVKSKKITTKPVSITKSIGKKITPALTSPLNCYTSKSLQEKLDIDDNIDDIINTVKQLIPNNNGFARLQRDFADINQDLLNILQIEAWNDPLEFYPVQQELLLNLYVQSNCQQDLKELKNLVIEMIEPYTVLLYLVSVNDALSRLVSKIDLIQTLLENHMDIEQSLQTLYDHWLHQ